MKMLNGLMWSSVAFIIIAIASFFYSRGNKKRKQEVKSELKIMFGVWLCIAIFIIIIFRR